MAEDRQSPSDPGSLEEPLAPALEIVKDLAEYARAKHLTQADELLTDFIALMVACGFTAHETE